MAGETGPTRLMRTMAVFADGYTRALQLLDVPRPTRNPSRALRLTVVERTDEADDVVSLRLAAPHRAALPAWLPGCHLDVHLASGRRRHYSLCGDPADRTGYRIAVRRIADGGGGSVEVHDTLRVGSTLTVHGPRNAFGFVGERAPLFVAGGIGITPILPMVRRAAAAGLDWRFVYTGRSRASMPFLAELAELDTDRVWIRPDDEHGPPDAAALLAGAATGPGSAVYCCGPPGMLDAVRREFAAGAIQALHFERFAPPPIVDGRPFEVQLARGGDVLAVPADRSALEVIRTARPDIAYSCQQGFCGTCRQRVLDGEVDHRDLRLTERQRAAGDMLICVSRADGGRLVLDL